MEKTDIMIRNLLDRQKVIALDDRVIVEFTNPIKEYRVEYKYSELKPRVVRGKSGDSGWTEISKFLITATAIIAFGTVFVFPTFAGHLYYKLAIFGLATLALLAFSLRMIKYDKVWFDDKDDNTACVIKLTKHNREQGEKIISYMVDKINQVESKTATKAD